MSSSRGRPRPRVSTRDIEEIHNDISRMPLVTVRGDRDHQVEEVVIDEQVPCTSADVVQQRGHQAEGGSVSDEMEVVEERRMVREAVSNSLERFVVAYRVPTSLGPKRCLFYDGGSGCEAGFQTTHQLRAHITNCFHGVFRICKSSMCQKERMQLLEPMITFSDHVGQPIHDCTISNGIEENGIELVLNRSLFNVPINGYNLIPVRRFKPQIEGVDDLEVLLALVIQNMGLDYFRVMYAAVVYSKTGPNPHHILSMELTTRGREGNPILPISCPDYNNEHPGATAVSPVFWTPKDFITASEQLDGVISFDSRDIFAHSAQHQIISLDVKLNFTRCVVEEEAEFPINRFENSWSELMLAEGVRETMDDGGNSRPSIITSALVSQFNGQDDIMVESIYEEGVNNAVMTAVIDHIAHQDNPPKNASRKVIAWVLFPTVSKMRAALSEWERRATAVGATVFAMENYLQELAKHVQNVGCEILMTVPAVLIKMLEGADSYLKDQLLQELKFVYLPSHATNCFPSHRPRLQKCMDFLRVDVAATIRIAHVLCMHPEIRNHTRTLRQLPNEQHSSAVFPRGWNLLSIGPDPKPISSTMIPTVLPTLGCRDLIEKITNLINRQRKNMRWVIVGMKANLLEQLGKALDAKWRDKTRVRYVTQERSVMMNPYFWQAFKERDDGIMIGPFFLLDSPESHCFDGLILLTEPIYEAESIRIKKLLELPNGKQKPVYFFQRQQGGQE